MIISFKTLLLYTRIQHQLSTADKFQLCSYKLLAVGVY